MNVRFVVGIAVIAVLVLACDAFHYDDLKSLKAHVLAFITAYNFAKHLKALKWKTPFQSICDLWKSNPSAFKINPHHHTPGLNTWSILAISYPLGSRGTLETR
jgi:hypothetical protein